MIIPNLPIEQYVRDAFDGPPSLNSGLAHLLLTRSPAHARYAHPRLNPAWEPDGDRGYDLGTAAHAVLLEGREQLAVLPFGDFRTKAAQAARDDAKAQGLLPVLEHQASDIGGMVTVARAALAQCPDLDGLLGSERTEETILWEEDGLSLRCRPDMMTAGFEAIVSYKTTRANAEPGAFLRTILSSGYYLQAAWELAGVKAETGKDAAYLWLAQEVSPPFVCSLIGMAPEFLAFAQQAMRKAVLLWKTCLETDTWPAYPSRVCYMDLPPWAQAAFIERHGYGAPTDDDDDRPIEEVMFEKGVLP